MHTRSALWPAAVALITTLSAIFISVPVAAQSTANKTATSLTMTQALQRISTLFHIPKYYKLSQESYDSSTQQGEPSYSFSFNYTSPDNQNHWINVSIGVASGNVLSYDASSLATGFVFPLPVSETKARSIAYSWARKLYPQQLGQVQLQPIPGQTGPLTQPLTYSFNFERIYKGLPVPFDGFSLQIDQNGLLTQVTDHWTQASFPSAKTAISLAQAIRTDRENLDLYLGYTSYWQGDAVPTISMTYQQTPNEISTWWDTPYSGTKTIGAPVINAQTGQIIDASGQVSHPTPYTDAAPIVPGGPTVLPGSKKVNWSQQQALSYAQKLLQLPADAKLTDSGQTQSVPAGDVNWNFTWHAATGSFNASVDATTGILTNFYSSGSSTLQGKKGPKQTQEQIDAQATAFLKRLFPQDTGGLALTDGQNVFKPLSASTKTVYSYLDIDAIVHGVPLVSSVGSLQVDPNGKGIVSYWMNLLSGLSKVVSPSKAIGISKANAAWMAIQPLQLQYLLTNPQTVASKLTETPSSQSITSPKVVLAYAPVTSNNGQTLNAVTGQMVNFNQNPQPYAGVIHDLKSVLGAPQVQIVVADGLLPVDAHGNVHPNRDMTRAEFVKLVVDALGVGNIGPVHFDMSAGSAGVATNAPAYSAIAAAYEHGWLQQGELFHPNAAITRGDAAQILVHALGYTGLLNHPGIFTLPAKDRAQIASNQIAGDAIANALGMLPLIQGKFDPNGNVTVAQASVAVVSMVTAWSQGQEIFSPLTSAAGKVASPTASVVAGS